MGDEAAPARSLTIPEAAELRGKTEAISQLLQTQLETHLATLQPLLAPDTRCHGALRNAQSSRPPMLSQ